MTSTATLPAHRPSNFSKYARPKIHCPACHFTYTMDLTWPQICEQCAAKLRAIDARSINTVSICIDMVMAGIPVVMKRGQDIH